MAGYARGKDDYLRRLRRIEGQVRGLQRMVEQDTYCIDVLTQVAAVTKALEAVSLGLLEDHVAHCVVEAAAEAHATQHLDQHRDQQMDQPADPQSGQTTDAQVQVKVKEAVDAIARLMRS